MTRLRSVLAVAIAIGTSSLLATGTAAAYCRSTTCSGECGRDADDCKTSGAKLLWPTLCVGVSLQEDGTEFIPLPEVERVFMESFAAWSDVDCGSGQVASLAFQPLDDVACHKAEYNPDGANANVVMFQDTRWTYAGEENNLAKTTVTYDEETGEILDADIELNHAFNEYTTGDDYVVYDLQSVLTHEIGHLLGLDHVLDFDATMNPGYEQGSIEPRTLSDDDIAGICAIYPPGRAAVCDATPHGGLGDGCGAEPTEEQDSGCALGGRSGPRGLESSWPAAAAAFWFALRLRRRRG